MKKQLKCLVIKTSKPINCDVIDDIFDGLIESDTFDNDKNKKRMETIEDKFTECLLDNIDKDFVVRDAYDAVCKLNRTINVCMAEPEKVIPNEVKAGLIYIISTVNTFTPDQWRSVDKKTRRSLRDMLSSCAAKVYESMSCDIAEISNKINLVNADEQREIEFVKELQSMSKEELIEMLKKQRKD